jgi:hypothetical protein
MLISDSSSTTSSLVLSILIGVSIVVGLGPSVTLSSACLTSYLTLAIA